MAEIFDIGKKFDEKNTARAHVDGVSIPSALVAMIDEIDPFSTHPDTEHIIKQYQQDIVAGVVAKEALKNALLKARRLS